ncbi:hypothetical protein EEI45_00745 [Erysipelothrix piscisicarius]|uniref:Uncharacterized protein n=2 Tax=Erysipelothrix piscisicarius TaxID=2485784 RepID=A0A3Q8S6J5_9FIRM|nr:hypothetical protein EEI45_00745 [Erysipelothrix piscisicarius]
MNSFFFGTSIGWIISCIFLVVQFAPRHLRHFPSVVAVCKDLAVRSFKNNQLGAILSTLESNSLEDTINQQTFTFLNLPLNNASACSIASLVITQHVEGLAVIAKATQSDGSNEVGKLK